MQLKISTAPRRTSKHWRNDVIEWDDLVERTRTTHRTSETHEQYMAMSAAEQSDVKDVGGFVAGHLADGRRKKGNVLSRSALALDIDFARPDIWLTLAEAIDVEAIAYTTHKHSPAQPRVRLVVPLAREVSAEEYVPIARRVASWVGMDAFDDSTYEPHRLMYWPSTSADGEYVHQHYEGAVLDPDEVLASYEDWTDASTWPTSSRELGAHAGHSVGTERV